LFVLIPLAVICRRKHESTSEDEVRNQLLMATVALDAVLGVAAILLLGAGGWFVLAWALFVVVAASGTVVFARSLCSNQSGVAPVSGCSICGARPDRGFCEGLCRQCRQRAT
jgi:hypothetical protein